VTSAAIPSMRSFYVFNAGAVLFSVVPVVSYYTSYFIMLYPLFLLTFPGEFKVNGAKVYEYSCYDPKIVL